MSVTFGSIGGKKPFSMLRQRNGRYSSSKNYLTACFRSVSANATNRLKCWFVAFALTDREDARRVDNGAQIRRVAELALHRGPSVDFAGHYQRHTKVV